MSSAPLFPLTIVAPGALGLNKQNSGTLLDPLWATEAINTVYDDNNRLSARKGWLSKTSTPISGTPNISQLYQYVQLDGDTFIVSAANNDIFNGLPAPSSIKGALSITANNWKFQTFNGNLYGLQASHPLIKWNGAGNFATVTAASGSVPNGNELLSAFGRLWGTSSDGQTLKWSGLLDEINWGSTGSGSINFTSIWPDGADKIVALASFDSFLVVLGKRNIFLLGDGAGSTIGIDPANIYVSNVISGIGCIARDSVQLINGQDLIFLSHQGLTSLRRAIESEGNPIIDISKNNKNLLTAATNYSEPSNIWSTFNPKEGFYCRVSGGARQTNRQKFGPHAVFHGCDKHHRAISKYFDIGAKAC